MKLFCECIKDAGVKSGHVVTALGNGRRQNRRATQNENRRKEGDGKETASLSEMASAKSPDLSSNMPDDDEDIVRASKAWNIPLDIKKTDPDQHLIFGWASVVEKDGKAIIDKQGDVIPIEELENAAYEFNLNSRSGGDMHARTNVAKLVESMVFTKDKQEALGIDIGQVGWWVGFKVHDEELWAAHKRGDRPEFSIGGAAIPIEIKEDVLKNKGGRRFSRFPFDSGAGSAMHHILCRFLANQRHNLLHEYSSTGNVEDIISVLEQDDIILQNSAERMVSHITRAAQRTGAKAVEQLGVHIANNVGDWTSKYGYHRAAELLGRRWDEGNLIVDTNAEMSINVTTNKIAKQLVTKALKENWPVDKFADRLDKIALFGIGRANMIAATEINTAQNLALLCAGFEFNRPVTKAKKKTTLCKLWTCGPNPCVVCEENCGEIIGLEEVFPSGDFSPSVHPNCMCEVELIEV